MTFGTIVCPGMLCERTFLIPRTSPRFKGRSPQKVKYIRDGFVMNSGEAFEEE